MTKCIQLLAQHTKEKILVCTHSNSAADHFVRSIVSGNHVSDICMGNQMNLSAIWEIIA